MRDWGGEFNVSHALTTNDGVRYLNTTLVTDDAFVANLFILSTVTLPVFAWSENFFRKETVLFWFLGSVVDGFWLGDFTKGPGANDLW